MKIVWCILKICHMATQKKFKVTKEKFKWDLMNNKNK